MADKTEREQYLAIYRDGQENLQAGQIAAAQKNFAAALGLAVSADEKAKALIGMGLACDQQTQAREEFEKAVAIKDASPALRAQAQMHVGASWRKQSWRRSDWIDNSDFAAMWAKARNAYAKVLEIPGVSPEQQTEAMRAMAANLCPFPSPQKYADAVAEFNAILETKKIPSPAKACVCLALGKSHIIQKDYVAARKVLSQALNLDAISGVDRAAIILNIGLSCYAEGDFEAAKVEFKKVLAMPDANAEQKHEAALKLHLRKAFLGDEDVITVLFVGCSHTDNGSIPKLVETLAASAPEGRPRIMAGKVTRGGHGLKRLWELGDDTDAYGWTPRAVIANEPWDYVVFQDIPSSSSEDLCKYAGEFAGLIRAQNARPVLYETFTVFKLPYPDALQKWHEQHLALKKELNAPLAPGGLAWIKYLGAKPTDDRRLSLYHSDHNHAGERGAYMLACCLYSALTGLSPVGLTHLIAHFAPDMITPEDARAYQEAAWAAFLEANDLGKSLP